jgi:hypothetical protein
MIMHNSRMISKVPWARIILIKPDGSVGSKSKSQVAEHIS